MRDVLITVITGMICLCMSLTAYAGKYAKTSSGPVGEFRSAGNTLGCNVGSFVENFNSNSIDAYMPCMKIGHVAIGASRSHVERKLRGLISKRPEKNGKETRVYVINGKRVKKGFMLESYIAIEYQDDVVESIQLTGKPVYGKLKFSSLSLGDPVKKIKKIFGNPTSTQEVVIDDKKITLYDYAPYPVTLEIERNRLYTIRLSRN